MFTRRIILSVLSLLVVLVLAGCAAGQDASKAISRGAINRGDIVPAESVRTNEYLNYYEQRFPEPVGQPLGLDLRLGNPQFPATGGEVWLQVGLQARPAAASVRTPLNLALVLDASGSMASVDKLNYLKQSLLVFLGSLHPDDIVAIISYSDSARLIRPAQPVGDGAWIAQAVMMLQPGGSTNLHDGLMMGFQEVDRNFDIRRNNRVLLMTDGIANVGETDPGRIAADALGYAESGLYLSTIGLGAEFNDQLLSQLARQGHGIYHYVDSAQEMEKVFRDEAEGLVERVADDVRLTVRPAPGVRLIQVTGFEGQPPAEGAQAVLQAMGAGDSQVVMVRFEAPAGAVGVRPLADITLDYSDVFAQRPAQVTRSLSAQAAPLAAYDPLADIEVRRNATIVRSAEALKQIDGLFEQARYAEAWQVARSMEEDLRAMAALAGDSQMVEDADLFRRYQITLTQALGYDTVLSLAPQSSVTPAQRQRWGVAPAVPTIELR